MPALVALLSLLPLGLLRAWASVEVGTCWARSAELLPRPVMNGIRWMRLPGDTLFATGALVLGWFVLGLRTGPDASGSAPKAGGGRHRRLGAARPGAA